MSRRVLIKIGSIFFWILLIIDRLTAVCSWEQKLDYNMNTREKLN